MNKKTVIKFLGTKGYIKIRTKAHNMHASLLIINDGKKIMIDCGLDWAKKVWKIKPDAILITHAHPDHSWGLKEGSPCPVWASRKSWAVMKNFKIKDEQKNVIIHQKKVNIFGIIFESFSQEHSTLAPANGYKIYIEDKIIYYSGDVVYINNRSKALKNVDLYIGDGATINRPMIRKNKTTGELFGHATIKTQLTWCAKENVPMAMITHCGTQIVSDPIKAKKQINELAKERKIKAKIAYDGMVLNIEKLNLNK